MIYIIYTAISKLEAKRKTTAKIYLTAGSNVFIISFKKWRKKFLK